MKLKKLIGFPLFILVLILTYTKSQLEFPIRRIPAKESMKLPFENLAATVQRGTAVRAEGASLLKMTRTEDYLYTIRIALGTPPQEFDVMIDTGSFFLWVPSSECTDWLRSKNKFDAERSDSLAKFCKRRDYGFVTGAIEGEICSERFNIGSVSLPQLKFLLADRVIFNMDADGILGLGRLYKEFDVNYSIIEALFRAKMIKKRMFSVNIEDNLINSKLTMGTLPKEIEEDLGNFTKCKVVTKDRNVNENWACNLKQLLIIHEPKKNIFNLFNKTEKAKVIKIMNKLTPVIFDTGTNAILAPKEYYYTFKYEFFNDMLENRLCWTIYDGGFTGFECNWWFTPDDAFPKLRFVLDNDFTYEFNVKDYFYVMNGVKVFRIMFGSQMAGDPWLFGIPFLQRYHVVYDHDDLTIGLYPKKKGTIVANSIVSLSEFEDELSEGECGNNVFVYLGIFYLCGLMLSLISVFCFKIFKFVFGGNTKVSELEQERMLHLVATEAEAEGENKTL